MTNRKPNHADAELILRLYDMRRESVMRESRKTLYTWLPRTFADVQEIASPRDPRNAAWRQVGSYFEMVYGFARHGIVPVDFLVENNAEGLLLFAKVKPYLAQLRGQVSPTAFRNTEWVSKKSAVAKERLELFKQRIAATLAQAN